MPRGLPKSIIKTHGISKKAWKFYREQQKKKNRYKKTYKGRTTKTTKRKRRVTKKKNRRRRNRKIPLAIVAGGLAGLGTEIKGDSFIGRVQKGKWEEAIKTLCISYTGYSPKDAKFMFHEAHGLQGLIVGAVIHKVMTWIGINRYLANLPSPLDKLSI